MTRSTKGVLCIVFPFATIFIALILFALLQFFVASLGSARDGFFIFMMIINYILGLLGLLGVLGIFIAIPIGVYLLITSEEKTS